MFVKLYVHNYVRSGHLATGTAELRKMDKLGPSPYEPILTVSPAMTTHIQCYPRQLLHHRTVWPYD